MYSTQDARFLPRHPPQGTQLDFEDRQTMRVPRAGLDWEPEDGFRSYQVTFARALGNSWYSTNRIIEKDRLVLSLREGDELLIFSVEGWRTSLHRSILQEEWERIRWELLTPKQQERYRNLG